MTVPALSAQGPGNFLRDLNCPIKGNKKGSAAGIQGTNDNSAFEGSSCVPGSGNATHNINVHTWVAWVASSFLLKVTKAYLEKTTNVRNGSVARIIISFEHLNFNSPLASVVHISHSTILFKLALNISV